METKREADHLKDPPKYNGNIVGGFDGVFKKETEFS